MVRTCRITGGDIDGVTLYIIDVGYVVHCYNEQIYLPCPESSTIGTSEVQLTCDRQDQLTLQI